MTADAQRCDDRAMTASSLSPAAPRTGAPLAGTGASTSAPRPSTFVRSSDMPSPSSGTSAPGLADLARVMADDSRATMLLALLDGRAWTAGELGAAAGVARSTASEHVSRLLDAELVEERRQGRHRYVRISDPEVAHAVESLSALAAQRGLVRPPANALRAQRADAALREARTCYHHLAGRLGVALIDALQDKDLVSSSWEVTDSGWAWLAAQGIDVASPRRGALVTPCLDWTERRDHARGPLAEAILGHLLEVGALARTRTPRQLTADLSAPVWTELGVV